MVAEPVHHHPLLDCAEKLEAELAAVADVPAVYLPAVEKAVALRAFARVEAELTEARLRILAAAGDLAEASACRDAGIWLANETRTTRPAGRRDLELANAIDSKYLKVAGGMRAGAVNVDQARVIVAALDALPADLDTQVLARAEAELVALAGQFDPTELRRIGRKILEVVAPEVAEDEEAKALEREEQRARETCSFRFKPQGDGTTRIAGLIPDAEANRLETYLNAYTSPRVATGPVTPRHRLLGQAFCALLEHLDPKKLPDHGGDATTVIVTIDHTQLLSTLGAADLLGGLDGSRISATE
ncbi:MAG: 13E12 repeat family protein, partial [Nocardioidaceae bacterium]|nr:13E12 repeat family protein [Nocardioidaceae bacterium]